LVVLFAVVIGDGVVVIVVGVVVVVIGGVPFGCRW
jgi:hypothetical protein